MLPTPKQFVALILGLAVWAICDKFFQPSTEVGWYAFEFSFPLCIGFALGLFNERETIHPLIVLALCVFVIDYVYQTLNPDYNPWTRYDFFLISASSFDCFVASFVLTQSRRIVTLEKRLKAVGMEQAQLPNPPAGPANAAFGLDKINTQLPKFVTLLLTLAALISALAQIFKAAHTFQN